MMGWKEKWIVDEWQEESGGKGGQQQPSFGLWRAKGFMVHGSWFMVHGSWFSYWMAS